MKVYSIILLRWQEDPKKAPSVLSAVYELSSFSYFQRGSVKEVALFVSREVAQRSKKGERQSISHQGHMCHSFVHPQGVACSLLTDTEYPQRVAFNLCNIAVENFLKEYAATFKNYDTDQDLQVPRMDALLTKYQDPETADPAMKIQKDLDETKQILVKSIDQILERGEKLETLAAKSSDLSFQSKAFMTNAEKMNKCCSYM
jgi:synaptobrevin homolog YKT6